MRGKRKIFVASIPFIIAALACVYGTTLSAVAQHTQSEPGAFEAGSEIHCFSIPEDQQDATCWVYNSGDSTIGFYHSDGQGPTAFWSIEDFQGMSASDDGRMAIVVTSHTVEVYTLLRKRPSRLTGITTPRTVMKIVRNDVNFLAASVAENKLQILIEGKEKPEIVALNQAPAPVETHTFNRRIFLPSVSGGGEVAPTPSACDEDPDCPGTPVVLPPGPRDTPEPFRCTGRSDDPPWCANRTPEPEFPTPAVATARP